MGWNSTVVVYNDALDHIEKDPEFGKNLSRAIQELPLLRRHGEKTVSVPAGNHANAALVVESHHADQTALVTVGGNLGICHLTGCGWRHHELQTQERLLAAWAEQLGFKLVKNES